jgi:hypothetical protein
MHNVAPVLNEKKAGGASKGSVIGEVRRDASS